MATTNDLRARLGARVRELRKARRLTQEQLGERAGLSYKFLGEIERGLANPTISTLANLASALDLDIGDLLVRPPAARAPAAIYTLSARDRALVREALESIEGIVERSEVTYPKRRRRR